MMRGSSDSRLRINYERPESARESDKYPQVLKKLLGVTALGQAWEGGLTEAQEGKLTTSALCSHVSFLLRQRCRPDLTEPGRRQ